MLQHFFEIIKLRMVREEQEKHFFSFLFLLKNLKSFLKGLQSNLFWSFQNLLVHYKSRYGVPVLPKTGLVFLSHSAQACLAAGSQPSKTCPSTSTAPYGYQQGFTVHSYHSPKDGPVCPFSELTLPVADLFNRDFFSPPEKTDRFITVA